MNQKYPAARKSAPLYRVSAASLPVITFLLLISSTRADDRAAPIPAPPADASTLPTRLPGVIMVRVEHGRLNVPLGGWGGQRLIQAKTDPDKFRSLIRALKERGLNLARPLFMPPSAANKNDAEWAAFDWLAMDRAVAITQEEGVYMLVDFHNWRQSDAIDNDEATWLKNWAWIAQRYKPYKHLIFEGFNEPQNQSPQTPAHYQKWIDQIRALDAPQLCVVSPFWAKYFPIKDPANNWAQCRHHYFNAGNSATPDKARAEANWQLANKDNPDSAASAIAKFGCGFFMTEGGIDDNPRSAEELATRIAGVQRIVQLCEQNGYGWCLWAHGDWSDGFDTYGTKIKTSIEYPSITGTPIKPN